MHVSVDYPYSLNDENTTLFPGLFGELAVANPEFTHKELNQPFWVKGTRPEDVVALTAGAMNESNVFGSQIYFCIEMQK